jgi:NADH-quinone oxidoreductase subunit N
MSAPTIWIILPGIVAILLYILRRFSLFVRIGGIATTLLLAILAWQIPINEPIPLGALAGSVQIKLSDTLTVLGRSFVISNNSRTVLVIIYLGLSIWFIGSASIKINRLFIPLGLAVGAILTAAISAETFLYAALLVQISVMLCIPILSPPGRPISKGALRLLTFQTIGMMLLVLAGWMIDSIQLNLNDIGMITRISVLVGLGFAMTMSIFPFSVWIPMSAEKDHPFATAFVFFTLVEVVSFFAFNIFSRYSWLQTTTNFVYLIYAIGIIMVAAAGLWSMFQEDLGRIFGYAMIIEIGLVVVTIGQILINTTPTSVVGQVTELPLTQFYFALLLPRGLNLAIWALALTIIKTTSGRLDFSILQGRGKRYPIATISILFAGLSLAGYPLLAGFPIRIVLGAGLATDFPGISWIPLLGFFGLIVAITRSIRVLLTSKNDQGRSINETRIQILLLGSGCILLIIVGLLPQFFLFGLKTLQP